jgi:hypothetical protein
MAKRLPALSPEEQRLRKLGPGQLADEIGELQARVEALKAEAIRRELRRAEGQAYRIVLSPPGTSQRTDKARLLEVLGISAEQFATRFCYAVHTGWRLTCTAHREREPASA